MYIHIRLITKLTGATWTTNGGSVNEKQIKNYKTQS